MINEYYRTAWLISRIPRSDTRAMGFEAVQGTDSMTRVYISRKDQLRISGINPGPGTVSAICPAVAGSI
jgi:hypothetical protein